MGTAILFEHNLEKWRESIGQPLISTIPNVPSTSGCMSPGSTSASNSSHADTPTREMAADLYVNLGCILESSKGLSLVEYYEKFKKFNNEQRLSLINIIANAYDTKAVHLSLAFSYKLEREILDTFPTEKLEYYRLSKRGKIYNKFANMRHCFKSTVENPLSQKKPKLEERRTRYTNHFLPEEDAEQLVNSLKYDKLSIEEFDACWKACAKFRLTQLQQSTSTAEILDLWPFYRAPSAARLIDMDFKMAFERNKTDGLLQTWEQYSVAIRDFLMTNVKDKDIKETLQKLNDLPALSSNAKDAAIFWALHGYFVPVVTGSKSKRGKVRYTIKDSQESFLFIGRSTQQVEDYLQHLKRGKRAIQPFIICTGEDVLHITSIIIYFDDVRYVFTSFLRAVDICFKLIYLFNLDFPEPCVLFYNFLEFFFYKFSGNKSSSKLFILKDCLESQDK